MKQPPSLPTDPIPQLTWRIALPTGIGMFFNTMFNFVDTYCAGLLGTDALAALSVSFPLFFLMIAGGIVVWLRGETVMGYFSTDPEVVRIGGGYLRFAAATLAAYPILFATVFMMQGLKRPGYGLWIGTYRQIAAPVPVYHALAFTFGLGLAGIWWGMAMVTWSAAIFALWRGWKVCRTLVVEERVPAVPGGPPEPAAGNGIAEI